LDLRSRTSIEPTGDAGRLPNVAPVRHRLCDGGSNAFPGRIPRLRRASIDQEEVEDEDEDDCRIEDGESKAGGVVDLDPDPRGVSVPGPRTLCTS
jgi:hypothetical protein